MPPRTWGLLRLTPEQGTACFAGQPLPLSADEVALLARLMDRPGEFVPEPALTGSGSGTDPARLVGHVNEVLQSACGVGYAVMHLPRAGYALALPGLTPRLAAPQAAGEVHGFPRLRHRVIGRDAVVRELEEQLAHARLITLVGAGGVGKTTVAVDVAGRRVSQHRDGGCFVDLSYLASGQSVPAAVAAELRMSEPGSTGVAEVVGFLRERQMLLVLDNCEHVVEDVAVLCEAIVKAAPRCHVLATSREPLRSRGEAVVRLPSLPVPTTQHAQGSAAEALRSPAVELFVERMIERTPAYRLRDEDSDQVVQVCRQVDGLPLALELVAALAERHSLLELTQRLAHAPLSLRNEAHPLPPRHESLETLLAWSHELLSPLERRTFEQLSIFRSSFTLASAAAVAGKGAAALAQVSGAVLSLAQKSLVVLEPGPEGPRCRYLETTRAFAFQKLCAGTDAAAVARRHALHLTQLFEAAARDGHTLERTDWRRIYGPLIHDVRAALNWCFGAGGDPPLGVELTVTSAVLGPQLSLWDEYWLHHERAVACIDQSGQHPAPRAELLLRNAHALFIGQNRGPIAEMRRNYDLCLTLAVQAGDSASLGMGLDGAWMGAYLGGDYPQALAHVDACRSTTGDGLDTAPKLRTARMMAQTLHAIGRHDEALALTGRLLESASQTRRVAESAIDPQVSGRVVMARIHWIQGRPDEAADVMAEALRRAEDDTSVSFAHAAAWGALPVALWRGDLELAQRLNQKLADHCDTFHLPYWGSWAITFRSALQGRLEPGALGWEDREIDFMRLDMLVTVAPFAITPEALARAQTGQSPWCAAEVLRAEGERHLAAGSPAQAALHFERALATAEAQRAPAWALRALTSLVRLDANSAHRSGLEALCSRFRQGATTRDLQAARALLDGVAPEAGAA